MLRALTIRNFALVAELDIEFAAGLTVITGESGAGKSILLDALGLVLGARVKRSQLRPGADACDVSAEFDISEQPATRAALEELSMLGPLPGAEDAVCLVRRTAGEGRSRAFVNGVPTTLAVLQNVTVPLIDIHGQHEHRQLLRHDVQRRLLDDFGVDPELVAETARCYAERAALAQELEERRAQAASASERERLLRYQVEELDALGETIGEVDRLTTRHRRLAKSQELLAAAATAAADLEENLVPGAARLANDLDGMDDDHASLRAASELAASAHTHLEEALGELRRYRDAFPEDEGELATLEETLATLHDMARKHRVPARELASHLTALKDELAALAAEETQLGELAAAVETASARYRTAGEALSAARRKAAGPFGKRVTATLAELGLQAASLAVEFAAAESAAGLETVAFLATTNPRYPAAALGDIASGGELARMSLAIEVVAAERSRLPCLILDEADIGVGGTTADVLGRMLRRLSDHTQVIAITHAPQIAALGDSHFQVAKTDAQNTVIAPLEGEARVAELARMVGGRGVAEDSLRYARTLLEAGRR